MPKRSWIVGLVAGWVALAVERVFLDGGPFRWSPPALRDAIATSVDERVTGLRRYAGMWFVAFVDEIVEASLIVGGGLSLALHVAVLSMGLCAAGDAICESTFVPVGGQLTRLHGVRATPVAQLVVSVPPTDESVVYKKPLRWSCALSVFERFPLRYPKSGRRAQTQFTRVMIDSHFSATTCLVAMGGLMSMSVATEPLDGRMVWYGPHRAVIELAGIDITGDRPVSFPAEWWDLVIDFAILDRSEMVVL